MPHVLVIDDAREIRDLFRVMLGKAGMDVSLASGAAEGAQLARQKSPHIILLDLEMPGRDGVSCLEELRKHASTAAIPVLMVSGTPVREVIVRVARMGVNGIILKNERVAIEAISRIRLLLKIAEPATDPGAAARAGPSPAANVAKTGDGRGSIASKPTAASVATASAAALVPTPATAAISAGKPAPVTKPAPSLAPRVIVVSSEEEDRESMRVSVLQLDGESLDIERATTELKALKPLMTRAALLERVLEGADLRALKPAAQQVLHLTNSSTASIDTIAKAIKQDQALSLKVLKVANSSLFTRGERIDSIQKAVSRIGIDQIRSTVLSLAVIDRFGTVNLANRIKADWFWEHSIACGLIASKIARFRNVKTDEVDSMFTAGLLHDIGRVIFAERLGEEYAGVIDVADQLEMPLETVESRLLLVNHADLTDRLLREWNFSMELVNPIALHHLGVGNIRRVAPKMAESVATLGLANRLAHALVLGGSGNEVIYPTEEFIQFLSLTGDQMRELCQTIPEMTLDLKIQMLASGGDPGTTLIEDARAQLTSPVRPLCVSMESSTDAVGIMLGRLCPGGISESPNIAVVRVVNARERAPLMTKLRQAEADAGVKALPTLVVGSGASCMFAAGTLGDRRIQQVILPLRLTRLIRTINSLTETRVLAVAA